MRPDIFLGNELAEIRVRDALRAEEAHRLLATADEGRRRRRPSTRGDLHSRARRCADRPSGDRSRCFSQRLSRRTATLVRLLDDCVFEDLGRSLASHD